MTRFISWLAAATFLTVVGSGLADNNTTPGGGQTGHMVQATQTIPAGQSNILAIARCPSGMHAVGGGYHVNAQSTPLIMIDTFWSSFSDSYQDPNGWELVGHFTQPLSKPASVTVTVECATAWS